MSGAPVQCPKCQELIPPGADRCACGHDLAGVVAARSGGALAAVPAIPITDEAGQDDGPAGDAVLLYEGRRADMATIRTTTPVEADLIQARLESEGIPCFLADRELAGIHPLIMPYVRVQVRAGDVARAKELLSRAPGPAADDEYAPERWRCPKCHRRNVELLPISRGHRKARIGCLAWAGVLVVVTIASMVASREEGRLLEEAQVWLFIPWLVLAVGVAAAAMLSKRRSRCRDCGQEWLVAMESSDGDGEDQARA